MKFAWMQFGIALMDIDICRMSMLANYYVHRNEVIFALCWEEIESMEFKRRRFILDNHPNFLRPEDLEHFEKQIKGW